MRKVIRRKAWEQGGVAEVVGTILILAMTVVLFAAIILWVSTLPTPEAAIRLDMDGQLSPIYDSGGNWNGVNVTIEHRGGESLKGFRTIVIMIVDDSGTLSSEVLNLKGSVAGTPYGIDGPDEDWDVGETWSYTNYSIEADHRLTFTVIDDIRSLVLWEEALQGPSGVHPPLFLEKWADRVPETATIDVPQTGLEFTIYAKVADQDGDLIDESVYVYLAFLFGTPEHKSPQRMYDDGTGGDKIADDGVFTATYFFFKPSSLDWDGGVVLFNATDLEGHKTTSRMTLEVQPGPGGTQKKPFNPGSGRPPNLNYNGLQGFNLFNGTSWDTEGFNATETRTFRESEEVVVVVGSAILTDTFGRNSFKLYDPYSSLPLDPVVYGDNKAVGPNSIPSSTQAFEFLLYVNGYNIWVHRFELNNASSVGINFLKSPTHPPEYFFSTYPLEIDIIDFLGNRFYTTDSIAITADDGFIQNYPKLETYEDAGYTNKTNEFSSTDVVYVQVTMKTVGPVGSVVVGNNVIQDFLGGTQVFRSPANGRDANPPICPVTGACTGVAVSADSGTVSYRWAINLTLADQDPWVEGTQFYSLRLMSILDADEEYSLVLSLQLLISSPLYRLDIMAAVGDTGSNAWSTHDVSYYWLNRNGVDKWGKERLHAGAEKSIDYTKAISYLDFDLDQDLDVVASVEWGAGQPAEVYFYRQDRDPDDNIIWTRSRIEVTGGVLVNDIRTGSLNKDLAPEIVVGGSNGHVWYYKNDGSWTKTLIDTSRSGAVNAIDVGDFDGDGDLDVAVVRNGGDLTYYPNLDGNGRFTSSTQTDFWYAEAEAIELGTVDSGGYTDTWDNDDVTEVMREESTDMPASWDNRTANADFSTGPGTISSGDFTDTQTQNDVPEIITETTTTGTKKALTHKWTMSLPSGGTKTFQIDAHRQPNNADDSFTFAWSTDDVTYNTLVTVTATSDTDSYLTATMPSSVSGTVYIRVTDSQQSNGESTDSIRIDHMYVETFYAAGPVSALEQYWRMQPLPSRPGSTYTFYLRALRDDVGNEGDNFQFAYSTTGQFGTYTDITGGVVNSVTETLYSSVLPSLPGQTVWIRATDMDRTTGNTALATLTVDQMYIEVYTPGGVTGSDIGIPGGSNVIQLDAGDYDGDGDDDVFVANADGNVYRLVATAGGLQPPSGAFATGLGKIGGLKLGNVTTSVPGLELAVASNNVIRIFNSDTGAQLSVTSAPPNGKVFRTLSMGDIDGDGDDDLIAGTGGGQNDPANLVYYRNLPSGWRGILVDPGVAGPIENIIYDTDVGDLNKAEFVGR